ncbi:MAG: adenine phosphoribosyltransferase [Spirochaetales bacterium]|nr:adenine phosphoribosyltransferase [Spirochaetales bacterium]
MDDFNIDNAIRKVPDFPKKGILFYDITSILADPPAFNYCIQKMNDLYANSSINAVAAIESRGFLFAAPFAIQNRIPLILLRKKGKLPGKTYAVKFKLEYGEDILEVHQADLNAGMNILLVDDLIATGGTIKAACELIEMGHGTVTEIFGVVGLPFLDYEKILEGYKTTTLINYQSEKTLAL